MNNKLLSADEAIVFIEKRIRQYKTGPHDTVQQYWEKLKPRLSEEAQDWLMQQGLRDRVTDMLHTDRYAVPVGGGTTYTTEVSVESSPAKDLFVEIVYSIEGEVKALGEFTEGDCYYMATQMKQKAHGLLAVAAFMEEAAQKLKQAKVTTINALPTAVRTVLEANWPLQGMPQ